MINVGGRKLDFISPHLFPARAICDPDLTLELPPYLTAATGIAARDTAGLEPALKQALATLGSFQPREWVLANMTDAICSRKLYELIVSEAGTNRRRI